MKWSLHERDESLIKESPRDPTSLPLFEDRVRKRYLEPGRGPSSGQAGTLILDFPASRGEIRVVHKPLAPLLFCDRAQAD